MWTSFIHAFFKQIVYSMVCLFLFFIFNVCSGLSDPLVRFMVSRNDSCVPSMRRKTDAVWNLISSEMARFNVSTTSTNSASDLRYPCNLFLALAGANVASDSAMPFHRLSVPTLFFLTRKIWR